MDNKIRHYLFVYKTEEREGKEAARIAEEIAKERGLEITTNYVSLREVIGYACDKLGNHQQNNPRTEIIEKADVIFVPREAHAAELESLSGMLEGRIQCLYIQNIPMTEEHWSESRRELKDKLSLRMPRRDS
jgi:hypothetical protein